MDPDEFLISSVAVGVHVIVLLNDAAPAALMSRVRAVMAEPPSSPLKIISLSDVSHLIIRSELSFLI